MKPLLVLLAVSLAANVSTAIVYVARPAAAPPVIRNWLDRDSAEARATETRQRAERSAAARHRAEKSRAATAQAKVWSALRADDLRTMVARLREAGFPATIIRGIVNAEVQAQFSARMRAISRVVEETPYWRPPLTRSSNNPKLFEERQQIYRDRAKLLRELLGPNIYEDTTIDPSAAQRRMYGDLPQSKIDMIQRINEDYAEMTAQVRAAAQGITLPEDREKMALLEREKRADLAALLTPEELENYEMRSSTTAMRLRSTMTYMNATEAEFRTIFRIQHEYESRLYPPSTGGLTMYTSEMAQQRQAATNEMNARIRAALGEARGTDFIRASNYDFQQMAQLAQRENRPMSDVARAYDLRESATKESARIGGDAALSPEQKRLALRSLAQNTKAQLSAALGPTAAETYAKSAMWLQAIENGNVVTIDGTSMNFRAVTIPVPPPRP